MIWTVALFSTIVQVKALGLNGVESHMRRVEWAAFSLVWNVVILVTAYPDGKFTIGTKAAAINAGAIVTATLRWREGANRC